MVTEKEIGQAIQTLAKSFDDELFEKTEAELEDYWHFTWDDTTSVAWNLYEFHDLLELYGNFCRRWEEHHNGTCCVVERVRDKYLMPKIREFVGRMKDNEVLSPDLPKHRQYDSLGFRI